MSPPLPPAADALSGFSPATRAWFGSAFPEATPVQQASWASIRSGQHTLVIAPTGSGKTLAAFLHAVDQLFAEKESGDAAARTRVLYISPIKALAADVQRNLQRPLQGVRTQRQSGQQPDVDIRVAIRSGDTPSAERARLVRKPPDILITTPESLFLILTSNARETLRGVGTIIIDEIHAVAGTKRGTHLALSLERLDALLERPAQRIGLSATVRPAQVVAEFLAGDRPVTVVNPPSPRHLEMKIVVPVEDMSDIPARGGDASESRAGSIWPHVEASILDEVLRHRSTIVFANSRGVAERLTARLNALYAERVGLGAAGQSPALRPEALGSFTGGTSGRVENAGELIARSHHGSVSKEQRAQIEQALKDGALRCVVATSSLELGIDMGDVDLVIQVAAPLSVASGLQRVGRAGHQVGGVSSGRVYPRTRRDLIDAAVVVESMLAGRIEALELPLNPLDVLAQQTVAAVAMEPLQVDAWYARVRRAAPYRTLPRSAFDATLDMLAGRYSSDDFASFRPRVVWDRGTGMLTARPGARQLAVTSGGTIPDRGLYSVLLPEGAERAGSRRVGELDEEMVHESRVNDVITLGATSWRIDQITHDQVIVSPAPGRSARLPFWRGEGVGRPAELGQAIGSLLGALDAAPEVAIADALPVALHERLRGCGLEDNAITNLLRLAQEQRAATGVLPSDQKLVVERSRDETGDWRLMLHSPYGRRVHDAWALAVADRLREQWHVDPNVVSSDDGIVARIPDTTGRVPDAAVFVFDPVRMRQVITQRVGGSALFAARFRECASRALLLPRQQPGKRSPLWQQRLRAGQLLAVAQQYPDFPILAETARECLQDVYDLDALGGLMQRIGSGAVQLVDVQTEVPSPFAADLLFGYVAEFLYGSDVPLAERRASVLALDSRLLGDLLGQVDLAELLDPVVVQAVAEALQRLSPERRVRGVEGIADVLRELGPMTEAQVGARLLEGDAQAFLQSLQKQRRVIRVTLAGTSQWAAIEDATRLRDALGVALPARIPSAFLQPTHDPLGDLVGRYARTHGPFTSAQLAAAFGLGTAVVEGVLERFAEQGRVLSADFGAPADPSEVAGERAGGQRSWVDEAVFARLRVRSLQAARAATRPAPRYAYVNLLLERQGVGALEGSDGVLRVIEQLGGVALPATVWEQQVLPARVRDYTPVMLDALIASGEVVWAGHARGGDDDAWVSLHLQESASESLPPLQDASLSSLQQAIISVLSDGGAYFARALAQRVAHQGGDDADAFHAALWALVWQGRITCDLWTPLRALGGDKQPRPRATTALRRRRGFRGVMMHDAISSPSGPAPAALPRVQLTAATAAGRWSLLQRDAISETTRAVALAEALLDRHGVVTRGAAMAEDVVGGFPAIQQVYRGMEDTGRVLRGRFVEGLGGAQFAERFTIDRLRELADRSNDAVAPVALSVVDPANPYGTVVPWPKHATGTRPVRRPGAWVVIGAGGLQMYLTQGGRSLLSYVDTEAADAGELLNVAARALATALRRNPRLRFTLELIDEVPVGRGRVTDALRAAGFRNAPRGLNWEG